MHKLTCFINTTIHYLNYLRQRTKNDRLTVNAGYMAYITLLSLVPLTTVILSALAQFPAFTDVGVTVQQFVIHNFVPAAGDAIKEALEAFVANTAQMTTVGAAFLFVTAILLISSIDNNLNYIWRVKQKRRLIYSLSIYWMVLTLGPLLVGASIAVSSHVASLKFLSNDTVNFLYGVLPLVFSYLAFFGLYLLVPNIQVRVPHALFGALISTILFEVSKNTFAYYISAFPTYHVIYGALAAVPILFVWIYLCWLIVLIGAELTASLGERDKWNRSIQIELPMLIERIIRRKTSDSSDTKSE
ncbi:virulence factor BrkB family protein [Vibrio sp. TH_r3]|uniref:virulence factor BrkB family protein n=1 Tax=Vibrio sp. TH_r3 TaxID=3082084 RepID=UPI0029547C82|nr:virulence factor BrkB family protein [Vibrio sp. TH_r3]MDV7104138.1 virulence factor BrkB family protein [Vibrio sp. TH_r3]